MRLRCRGRRDCRARSLRARGAACERQQRDVARALDRFAEPALMARANARHAARQNLSALLHELRQNVGALVVDEVHLLDTELADFLLAEILALAAARTAGTSWTAAWAAFAARTTVTATGAAMSAAGTVSTFAARRTARGCACFCSSAIPAYLSELPRIPFQIFSLAAQADFICV